jgi:hypothetical protein
MREQTGWLAGQSARYAAGTTSGIDFDDLPHQTDDKVYDTRPPTSVRRYQSRPQPANQSSVIRVTRHNAPVMRASLQPDRAAVQPGTRLSPRWGVKFLLILFAMMIIGWILISALFNWWRVHQDDVQYGRPRTFQADADVGHGGRSHFTVQNLDGKIIITELPNNDPTRAKFSGAPTLAGSDAALLPATVSFEHMNEDDALDLVLTVANGKYVFLNNGKDGFDVYDPKGSKE